MKRLYYRTEKELEGLKWTGKVIDFGMSLSIVAAANELYCAEALLRQHPDLWKREVKQYSRAAAKAARDRESAIRIGMKDSHFWDDYSDRVIDEAERDVRVFRNVLCVILSDSNVPDAELYAAIECARVLVEMCVHQYEEIMNRAKEKFNYDFTERFSSFYIRDVLYKWDKMCSILYRGYEADLNRPDAMAAFDSMCVKFTEGLYVQSCLDEAERLHPEFTNEIIVK